MVSKHFYPFLGGLEARVLDLGKWMVENGSDVMVLTSHEEDTPASEDVDGISVHRSSTWFSLFNGLFCPGILKDLLTLDYDIIDVNLPDPVNSVFAYIASVVRGKPLTVTYHADILKDDWYHKPFTFVFGFLQRLILGRAKVIFSTSPNYAESSPVLKKYLSKVSIASSFVDPARFHPDVECEKIRSKHVKDGEKLVLFVGRLIPYKGLFVLLKAFKGLVEDVDARLIIAGTGVLEEDLRAKILELGLYDKVVFAGKVSDEELPSYYRAADLFVLPSINRAEAFGLVLAEAMSCATPVVTTDFSGMPYVMKECGLKVKPGDPVQLKSAMLKILLDSELSGKFGSAGRCRVQKLFTAEVVGKKILKAYNEILG